MKAKDFRLEKLFSEFGSFLKKELEGVYKEKELEGDFKSFEDHSSGVPRIFRLEEPPEDEQSLQRHLERVERGVELSGKAKAYFEARRTLADNDLNQMRKLKKTIDAILIRKNILDKKQEMQKVGNEIKVV